jgi:hypothetical protein
MEDTARHGAPQRDVVGRRHTMCISLVATELESAGVPRSHRHIIRLCRNGSFDAEKYPGASGDEWFVAPDSLPKVIGDLRAIEEARARRGAPQHAATDYVAVEAEPPIESGTARHGAPQPPMSDAEQSQKGSGTERVIARHGAPELDIFEHPYVKRLESQVEKWEGKYHEQVRRTEEIQLKGQAQLLELQRMTAVGQSQTLADFMLKARDWVLGQAPDPEKREADSSAAQP